MNVLCLLELRVPMMAILIVGIVCVAVMDQTRIQMQALVTARRVELVKGLAVRFGVTRMITLRLQNAKLFQCLARMIPNLCNLVGQ